MTDHGLSPGRADEVGDVRPSLADELIDELVPGEVDWRSVVRSYPKLSFSLVAVAGFWLGRTRGRAIIAGVTGMITETVNDGINEFFGREVV